MEKRFLTAAEILTAQDSKTVDVDVPEWGGTVKLRTLTGAEAAEFFDAFQRGEKSAAVVKLPLLCAVAEDGVTPLFTEGDLVQLRTKSLSGLMRLQRAAVKLNGLTDEAAVEVKND